MVQLTRIYTRGGDSGETSLGSGKRVPKYDTRVSAYGTVDEANSVIGIVRLNVEPESDIDKMLARLQNDLFDLGADLCTPEKKSLASKDNNEALRIVDVQVARLEKEIDELRKKCMVLRKKIKESVLFLTEYACLCSDDNLSDGDLEDIRNEDDSKDNVSENKEELDNEGTREL